MFEFHIVSLDNKQWFFEAGSSEERDEWVTAIEQQILNSLQGNEISKGGQGGSSSINSVMNAEAIKTIKNDVPGNNRCVDCDAPSKYTCTFVYSMSRKFLYIGLLLVASQRNKLH